MNDNQKRQYDALQSLEEQSWAEFKEKTQLEWRLSFGYWTALVTAIGSILAGICIFLLLLHLWFLRWIQESLGITRKYIYRIRAKMYEIAGLSMDVQSHKIWWKQPSLHVQLGITVVLLGVLFSLIFYMSENNKQGANPNTVTTNQSSGTR